MRPYQIVILGFAFVSVLCLWTTNDNRKRTEELLDKRIARFEHENIVTDIKANTNHVVMITMLPAIK